MIRFARIYSLAAFAINAALLILFLLQPLPAMTALAQEPKSPGEVAYNRVCSVCHGPKGRGDAGPRLVPFDRDYVEVLGIVRDGRGEMPPKPEREVSDREVAQIVEYLKSLPKS